MMDKRGVTLTELIIVIAIIGIMAAFAVPNLGPWLAKQKLNSAARQIATHFNMARSQAIRGNEVVRISFNTAGRWYTVVATSEGTIVPAKALPKELSIAVSFPSAVNASTTGFDSRGMAWDSSNGTVTITSSTAPAHYNQRVITLSLGGGVSITP